MLYSSRKNLQTCHSNPLFRPPYSSKVTLNINLDALRFEFYTNGAAKGHLFTTFVRGVPIHLVAKDITHILVIRLEGWDQYVKFEWPLPEHRIFFEHY